MRRLVGPALSVLLLVAAAVVVTGWLTGERADHVLKLSEVDGRVSVTTVDDHMRDARVGQTLSASDRVATGEASRAVLSLGTETRIRLGERSTVQVRSVGVDEVSLELEGGLLQATVRPDSGAVRVSHGDRQVLATDADFTAGVGTDSTLAVESTRGDVALQGLGLPPVVREGQRVTVTSEGHAELGVIPDDLLLKVPWPETDQRRLKEPRVTVSGQTVPGASVRLVAGAERFEVTAGPDGAFAVEVPLFQGENAIRVEATDVLGNRARAETVYERDVRGPGFNFNVKP